MRRWPVLVVLAAAPIVLHYWNLRADRLRALPAVMLWAWESAQDLRFVTPGNAGIAFLARTIRLSPEGVRIRPRQQALRFAPGTALMPVVRLESAGTGLPSVADAIAAALPAAHIEGALALQVDFDARLSERDWYATFLHALKPALPAGVPLTITALQSWCEEGNWVDSLPVVDATPMLFRLGRGERPEATGFAARICRASAGVSTDEFPVRVPRVARLYFFHAGPWTPEAYDVAIAQARRWKK